MGTEDMRRQKPNVERMRLLGARVEPVEAGRAHAQGGGVGGDPRLGHERRRRPTTSSARASGPAPYPALVRDLQRVIGDEARAQVLEQAGRLPQRVIACVGGGSNSIGIFTPFVEDAEVELVGVEAAGEGLETGRHGAPLTAGGLARRPARRATRRSCRTRTARSSRPTRSRPASTTPAAAPSTRGCATRAGPRYVAVTDGEALAGVRARWPGWRGSSRRSRAPTRSPGRSPTGPASSISICLSGRGDKDLAEALEHARPRASSRTGRDRHRADRRGVRVGPRRRPPGRADAVPDGRLSRTSRRSRRIGIAYAEAGADLVELGVPFSDPLADGPVIHAAATAALRRAPRVPRVLEVGAVDLASDVPVIAMCYANPILARGLRAVRRRAGGRPARAG